ncbi:biopolymer transporter ExbD [Sutterella sp.]|uniref:ExbD/TolR family protein n=1 Tax=Sutterella sp. TaxID=1981025 RepID=UPI0026E0BD1A|nr:biopolymer transporter ExbD [Sutterella sp.]MDO5532812.1 biopolymer transporter ExbD [Sutterella sp.]
MTRRRKRASPPGAVELNMTPLIDMIFILLIFFMVSASFVRESGVDVERPVAKTASSRTPAAIVSIDSANVIWIDGRTIDVRSVGTWMRRFHADSPEGGVVIAADAMARTGVVIQVLDACREAGVRDVSVAARAP